jgi:hypothetical protein
MGINVSPSDVRKRDEVSMSASHNIDRAVDVAHSVQHPWYRCQSLAYAAEAHPDRASALQLLEEAFRAAAEQAEINRIVTVASWPLSVCVKIAPEVAKQRLAALLKLAEKEPHGLRRGDALCALLVAVTDSPELKALVLTPIVDTVTSGHGWRIERLIAHIALSVRADHPHYLPRLLEAHPDNRRKRKLLEALNDTSTA